MRPEEDPDPGWVAELSASSLSRAESSLREAQGERRLFSHLAREHASEGRDSYIEIDAPLELYALVRLMHPQHVVEIGVSSGVSSAYLLSAMQANGRGTLHSIDLPSNRQPKPGKGGKLHGSWSLPPGRSSGWAVPFPLRKRWDLRLGDKADVLPLLAEELPRIDLLLYDVPHRDRVVRRELSSFGDLIPPGGVVIIDHGPGGELCSALDGWARSVGSRPVGRQGLGLYAARCPTTRRRGHGR